MIILKKIIVLDNLSCFLVAIVENANSLFFSWKYLELYFHNKIHILYEFYKGHKNKNNNNFQTYRTVRDSLSRSKIQNSIFARLVYVKLFCWCWMSKQVIIRDFKFRHKNRESLFTFYAVIRNKCKSSFKLTKKL